MPSAVTMRLVVARIQPSHVPSAGGSTLVGERGVCPASARAASAAENRSW